MDLLTIFYALDKNEKRIEHTCYVSPSYIEGYLAGNEVMEIVGAVTNIKREKYACTSKVGEFNKDMLNINIKNRYYILFTKQPVCLVYSVEDKKQAVQFMKGFNMAERLAGLKNESSVFYLDNS
jgi:hypothetical protein